VADALAIPGVATVGDANMLTGLRLAGWDIGELLDEWDGESQPVSNCSVGSCGIQR
jgi:vacuolar-type H+-ATPase subunit F/Vma7